MSNNPSPKATESQPHAGLGLERFAMSAVGAYETQEASEISRRWMRTLTGLVLFALLVAAGIWWFTAGRDLFFRPSPEDGQFLLSLQELEATRRGLISNFEFAGVKTLKFEVSPQLPLRTKENQLVLRQATVELVAAFSDYREGAAVRVQGYQQKTEVVEGRRLLKAEWQGRNLMEAIRQQERELPVWVDISGEKPGLVHGSSGE